MLVGSRVNGTSLLLVLLVLLLLLLLLLLPLRQRAHACELIHAPLKLFLTCRRRAHYLRRRTVRAKILRLGIGPDEGHSLMRIARLR
jgi:hypothetical protein